MGARFRVGRIAAAARVLWRFPTPTSAPAPTPTAARPRTRASPSSRRLCTCRARSVVHPSEVRERLAVEAVKLFSSRMNQQDRSFWSYLIGYNCGALIILGNANRELDQRAKALAEEREAL
uniref:Uncharacterized protein n=1 Tax=Oryza meridionalis TaxID=40149 RepID=A0A0E0E4M8_9ORYZ